MRPYPRNSPQAAARIVALTLLSDGQYCRREREMLEQLDVARQLGLERQPLHQVLHELCEDLLAGAAADWAGACRVEPRSLEAVMGELTDAALRRRVLALCEALAAADGRIADGEAVVLDTASRHWGLHGEPAAGRWADDRTSAPLRA